MSFIVKLSLSVSAACFVLLGVCATGAAQRWGGRGYLELDAGYRSGDFGTPTASSLLSLSPTLGYVAPRYSVSVTAPLLSLNQKTDGSSTTESGIGDVILRAGAVLLQETGGGLSINCAAAVKAPTADETRGLVTGEEDFGGFAGLSQRIWGAKLLVTGGYLVTGDPSGTSYKDIPLVGLGVSKIFGMTNVFASLEGRRANHCRCERPCRGELRGVSSAEQGLFPDGQRNLRPQ